MIFNSPFARIVTAILLTGMFYLTSQTFIYAAGKNKKNDYVMTEIELQSELMSYADRFASILAQSLEDFDALGPSPESRRFVLDDMVHAVSSAFTTAAEPNPQTALLDMVAITTLGRMIYEDNIRRKYGKPIEAMARGFGQLEKDIWQITTKILSVEQQHELRAIILEWRKRNPDQVMYNYFRFSEFAANRRKSTLVKKDGTGGLFKSVQQATQQVEETRMLAERALYLATRLPLLTGGFAEVWLTQLLVNPKVEEILSDVSRFSAVSERLATVAEQLPAQISEERGKTIEQFMDRLGDERKKAFEDLLAEEQKIKGLVSELRLTLAEGNNLLASANTLTDKFNVGKPSDKPNDSKPFDIKDYQDTIAEVTKLIETTNRLVASAGINELLAQLTTAVDKVEGEGEELVDYSFKRALILIPISMMAYVLARLMYNFLNKKLIESRT